MHQSHVSFCFGVVRGWGVFLPCGVMGGTLCFYRCHERWHTSPFFPLQRRSSVPWASVEYTGVPGSAFIFHGAFVSRTDSLSMNSVAADQEYMRLVHMNSKSLVLFLTDPLRIKLDTIVVLLNLKYIFSSTCYSMRVIHYDF